MDGHLFLNLEMETQCFGVFSWTLTFWGLEDKLFTLLLSFSSLYSPYSSSKCPDLTWAQVNCFLAFPGACGVISGYVCP